MIYTQGSFFTGQNSAIFVVITEIFHFDFQMAIKLED